MAAMTLTKTRIQAGMWEGVLDVEGAAGEAPEIVVTHLEQPLDGVSVNADPDRPGAFLVRVPIAAELLSDGVQSFVITDGASGERLNHFTIVTGQPIEDDIRAEMDLLRAELDMLKRAFRRHCVETM